MGGQSERPARDLPEDAHFAAAEHIRLPRDRGPEGRDPAQDRSGPHAVTTVSSLCRGAGGRI